MNEYTHILYNYRKLGQARVVGSVRTIAKVFFAVRKIPNIFATEKYYAVFLANDGNRKQIDMKIEYLKTFFSTNAYSENVALAKFDGIHPSLKATIIIFLFIFINKPKLQGQGIDRFCQ